MWGKVAKSKKKWLKVVKSGDKWQIVGKSGEKWRKVAKSGENWVAKSTVYVPIDAHCASADLRVCVYLKKNVKKKNFKLYLSIINCVCRHRCECVVISLSYKCQCILICTRTVNEVNLNLFLVWPRSLE